MGFSRRDVELHCRKCEVLLMANRREVVDIGLRPQDVDIRSRSTLETCKSDWSSGLKKGVNFTAYYLRQICMYFNDLATKGVVIGRVPVDFRSHRRRRQVPLDLVGLCHGVATLRSRDVDRVIATLPVNTALPNTVDLAGLILVDQLVRSQDVRLKLLDRRLQAVRERLAAQR